ncbi:MAG: HAD-IC family P-type ATPase, partial [Clostridia bacterium]
VGVIDGKLEGFVAVSDTIRQNAKAVVEYIKEKNYEIMVLTGDNKQSALNVAELCGVESDNVRYSLLPQDKLGIVENLQNNSKKVCMLGDGINDAPALKLANCGIAMGALGSDIAIDSADVAIMNSDIAKLGDTLTLSKRVMNAIKRNIIIAMSINVVSVILSTFGLLTPVTGAIVHNVTSILVVASSSMLLFSKNRKKQKAKNDTIIQN